MVTPVLPFFFRLFHVSETDVKPDDEDYDDDGDEEEEEEEFSKLSTCYCVPFLVCFLFFVCDLTDRKSKISVFYFLIV